MPLADLSSMLCVSTLLLLSPSVTGVGWMAEAFLLNHPNPGSVRFGCLDVPGPHLVRSWKRSRLAFGGETSEEHQRQAVAQPPSNVSGLDSLQGHNTLTGHHFLPPAMPGNDCFLEGP